jgi:serine protease Do
MPAPDKKNEQLKPTKKTKPSFNFNGMALAVIGLAFVAGIFGGYLGAGLNKQRITSLDNQSSINIASSQSDLISSIAKDVSPSVVSINTETNVSQGFFNTQSVQSGAGTGIIISSDGYIVTNKHVIPDGTDQVNITTSDGKVFEDVKVVARDPRSGVDIAFLKIPGAKDLKPAKLGNSSEMVVGDGVVAIGYALGEFQNTVTSGIISGLGRPVTASDGDFGAETLTNLFQTDAAINPGNSGGPLLNLSGEVIGINTAVAGGAENIGFSIPIDDVKPQIESILKNGKLEIPYMGVRYVMLTEGLKERYNLSLSEGAWLKASNATQAVINGSPADKAGLREGDIIFKVNGQEINYDNPLATVLSKYGVGDKIDIEFNRDGTNNKTTATLEVAPDTVR